MHFKSVIIFTSILLLNCSDPTLIANHIILHFYSDIDSIGQSNLNVVLSAKDKEIILSPSDFWVCPDTNDTCDDRFYYDEVPNYTLKVPMSLYYEFSEADGDITINPIITRKNDTIVDAKFSYDPMAKTYDFLIYLGHKIDTASGIIFDFKKVNVSPLSPNLRYISFGTANINDSLVLVWVH